MNDEVYYQGCLYILIVLDYFKESFQMGIMSIFPPSLVFLFCLFLCFFALKPPCILVFHHPVWKSVIYIIHNLCHFPGLLGDKVFLLILYC